MAKINRHIQIVRSTQTRLSSLSQASTDAILQILKKHYATVGVTIVNELADLEALVALQPDLVFLGLKYVPTSQDLGGPTIWVADYLDQHGIAYTGSTHLAHELELNKPLAKQRALELGLKTSPFYVAVQNVVQSRAEMTLRFPLFIKPVNRGGGLGIDEYSIVNNFDELERKVQSITAELQSDSLIEEYLPGREFSVAILKDEASDILVVMPIELVATQNDRGYSMLSDEVKTSNQESVSFVADEQLRDKVKDFAVSIYKALGARDYGRIDIRLDESGVPHFLEANLIPSLIDGYGSFPKAALLNENMDHESLILNITKLGLSRSRDSEPSLA